MKIEYEKKKEREQKRRKTILYLHFALEIAEHVEKVVKKRKLLNTINFYAKIKEIHKDGNLNDIIFTTEKKRKNKEDFI